MDKVTTGSGIGMAAVATPGEAAYLRDIAELEPIAPLRRRWPSYLGAAVTVVMVVLLGWKLSALGWLGLIAALPGSPWFYLFFLLLYFAQVAGDFVIFRGLWHIPPAGFVALTKKRIANDMVNYSGEAYFYAWARQRAAMVAAPFGAVKDVSILSAIAGNMVTLGLVALALPFGIGLLTPHGLHNAIWSIVAVFAMSLPFLVFSKRVFSLPRRTLWWIFAVHCLRLVVGTALVAVTWHFGLPSVSVGMWLLLSAARMIVSRLPLLPNKDLLFAYIANLFIGQDVALSVLLTLTAALPLLVHVVLVGVFFLADLVGKSHART